MNRAVRCYKEHSLSLEWRNERQIQTHTHTREHTHTHTHTHTPSVGAFTAGNSPAHWGLNFFSLRSLHGKLQLQTLPMDNLDSNCPSRNRLDIPERGCNVEGGDVFWGMCNPALLFWSALIKVLFKACPVPVGLKVRMFIDTPVRKGCLMNAGDCGKVSELGKWGKDMRY